MPRQKLRMYRYVITVAVQVESSAYSDSAQKGKNNPIRADEIVKHIETHILDAQSQQKAKKEIIQKWQARPNYVKGSIRFLSIARVPKATWGAWIDR
jgi:hypothetical protein